jgi:hypothetical protein
LSFGLFGGKRSTDSTILSDRELHSELLGNSHNFKVLKDLRQNKWNPIE